MAGQRYFTRARTAAAVVSLFALCTVAAAESAFIGTVYGDETNEYGDLISVVLAVEGEESSDFYAVVMDKAGLELLDQIGNDVTLTAELDVRADGTKWLTVNKWELKK